MKTSYIVKTSKIVPEEQLDKLKKAIVNSYERSLKEKTILVLSKDIELYKLENNKYVRVI